MNHLLMDHLYCKIFCIADIYIYNVIYNIYLLFDKCELYTSSILALLKAFFSISRTLRASSESILPFPNADDAAAGPPRLASDK